MDDDILGVGVAARVQSTQYKELLFAVKRPHDLSELRLQPCRQWESGSIDSIERRIEICYILARSAPLRAYLYPGSI